MDTAAMLDQSSLFGGLGGAGFDIGSERAGGFLPLGSDYCSLDPDPLALALSRDYVDLVTHRQVSRPAALAVLVRLVGTRGVVTVGQLGKSVKEHPGTYARQHVSYIRGLSIITIRCLQALASSRTSSRRATAACACLRRATPPC